LRKEFSSKASSPVENTVLYLVVDIAVTATKPP
jgi:hypothetical protein